MRSHTHSNRNGSRETEENSLVEAGKYNAPNTKTGNNTEKKKVLWSQRPV